MLQYFKKDLYFSVLFYGKNILKKTNKLAATNIVRMVIWLEKM